jgi:hypothetical protein
MLNKSLQKIRTLLSFIRVLLASRGAQSNGHFRQHRPVESRINGGRVRYSYLASARRVRVGTIVSKRFELNTDAGRRIITRKFKVLKHGNLVAA